MRRSKARRSIGGTTGFLDGDQIAMSKVWYTQLLLLVLVAAGFFLARDAAHAAAAILGGLAAVANTWVLARAVHKAGEQALAAPGSGMGPILMGLVLRIMIFGVVLLGATQGLGLPVVPIIIGFLPVVLAAAGAERLPRPGGT